MFTVADAIAKTLEKHGIDLFVGQSLPSALHLAAEETSIRQVHIRTENAGTAMCDAYARLTGKIAVMTAQNGPAATLLVPGLAEAMKTSTPILAIVQEVDLIHRGKNAFQEYDHIGLFSTCSKWTGTLDVPERVYDMLNIALTHAVSGRPGPTVLMVSPSVLAAPAPEMPETFVKRGHYPLDRPSADKTKINEAAALLSQAKRPLIVSGGGVHTSGATAEIGLLQDKFGIPVGTTLMGKGSISEVHPLSLGVIGYLLGKLARNHAVRDYVENADIVMFVGARNNQNGTDSWSLFGSKSQFIHLDIDGTEVGRNYESLRLVGDAKTTLSELAIALEKHGSTEGFQQRSDRLASALPKLRAIEDCIQPTTSTAVRPERILETINRLAPENTVLAADASYSSAWVCGFGEARTAGKRFITPRGLAGLGWGLPYMIGAKLARPGSTVVGLSGDGGFSHVWGELETAARYNLHLIAIVLKNGILGYQRDAELVKFGRHTSAIPIMDIDHAAIANAAGCVGISIETQEEFEQAFKRALTLDGPVVLDVRTDPSAFPTVTLLDGLND